MQERLAHYKHPKIVEIRESLPKIEVENKQEDIANGARMKALVVNAEWRPKNYRISEEEILKKRAIIGSQVWKIQHLR